jgi:hypothetical protein
MRGARPDVFDSDLSLDMMDSAGMENASVLPVRRRNREEYRTRGCESLMSKIIP